MFLNVPGSFSGRIWMWYRYHGVRNFGSLCRSLQIFGIRFGNQRKDETPRANRSNTGNILIAIAILLAFAVRIVLAFGHDADGIVGNLT
eukprot:scaffold3077_cov162-Amphora_coffeaeformis.AAC.25